MVLPRELSCIQKYRPTTLCEMSIILYNSEEKGKQDWVKGHSPRIPAQRLRQEDGEIQAGLSYIAKACLKNK